MFSQYQSNPRITVAFGLSSHLWNISKFVSDIFVCLLFVFLLLFLLIFFYII